MLPFQIPSFYAHIEHLSKRADCRYLFTDSIKPFLDDFIQTENTRTGLTFHEAQTKVFEQYPQLSLNPAKKSELTNEMIEQSELYARQHTADVMKPKRKLEYATENRIVVVTRGKAGTRIRVYRTN